jgi:hypothetical protein
MWGYQLHFRVSAQLAAESLFKALHPDFEVELFLLGLAREDAKEVHQVCLDPEECGFSPSDFAEVRSDAEHHRAVHRDRNLICSHPTHQASCDARIKANAEEQAVLSVLNGWRRNKLGEYYFSGFIPVSKHDVGVVLRVRCNTTDQPYRLPRVHAEDRYGPTHSLVEAAAREFLRDCLKSLHTPSPEYVADYRGRNTDELLRQAGNRLMESPVWAGSDPHFLYGLFGACNFIAELTYESEGTAGELLIAPVCHKNIEHTLLLKSPFSIGQHRAVRKLLQIASGGDALLCDGSNVIGFGRKRGNYDQRDANLFEVRFTRHHHWELSHAGHAMMRVAYGKPTLPRAPLNTDKLASDLRRVFRGLRPDQVERLVTLALCACKQRHGALLVIAGDAESEAKRLANQSTLIEPILLTEALVAAVTAIDGAVLLTPDGTCFAVGVILDGLATPKGNPARGARFNSSVRYVADKKNCVAIIVSEDGTAEWIPDLRPQLARKELNEKSDEIAQLLAQPNLDADKARPVVNWLKEHRFYLSQPLCDVANELKKRFDEQTMADGGFMIVDGTFVASPEMNDEYLID